MRGDLAIQVENLGKSYIIGHKKRSSGRADTMRDAVASAGSNFVRALGAMLRGQPIYDADRLEEFWALQDVSFDIGQGEAVGIIGRNGAGKSTLLKVLSRITEPSRGRVRLRGRVASLLEVGTGFHPELSGRENIFLNGAILGMSRAEVSRKFDEIIDFAGVERFLDTPVKRYSSGMYVRLAFAVAAHLEPEILVVDEVLAVGDAEFQKKCLGKMNDVAAHGRTVLFVSHNLDLIRQLCTRGIYLKQGRLIHQGPVQETMIAYLDRQDAGAALTFHADPTRPCFTGLSIDEQALQDGTLDIRADIAVPPGFGKSNFYGGIILKSLTGIPVWGSNSQIHPSPDAASSSTGTFTCRARDLPLIAGEYLVSAWLSNDDEAFDSQIDVTNIFLSHNPQQPRRPSPDVMGYIEHAPSWSFEPK